MLVDPKRYELGWRFVLLDGVDRVKAVQHHFCLAFGVLREDETRAIAKSDLIGEFEGLEMFGLSWHAGDSDFLLAKNCIDDTRLSDIRISSQSDLHLSILIDQSPQRFNQLMRRKHFRRVETSWLFSFHHSFFLRGEEAMIDALALEVGIPGQSDIGFQQIALVNDHQEPSFAELSGVLYQILTVEEERVPSIYDLSKHISSFHYSPQLFPHLDVLLIRSDGNLLIFFFNFRKRPPPLQVGLVLHPFQLLFAGSWLPLRPSGQLQSFQRITFYLGPEEPDLMWVVNRYNLFCGQFFPDVLEFDVSIGVEVLLAELGDMQELGKGVLLDD